MLNVSPASQKNLPIRITLFFDQEAVTSQVGTLRALIKTRYELACRVCIHLSLIGHFK